MKEAGYPRVTIDLKKLRNNIDQVLSLCRQKDIEVAGVIKGCTGIPECAEQFAQAGCRFIASSRVEQLEGVKNFGIKKPLMMIRVPMISEAAGVVRIADISLNSEVEVLKALNEEAGKQGKIHKVILMVDLGDLREGFWEKEDLLAAALMTENELQHLELAGIGTNVGCYGSINATTEKLTELVEDAQLIEENIGRELEFISGGATSSLMRVMEDNIPARINLLRLGEGILIARDLQELWGYDMSYLHRDVFLLQAEVIEVRTKASYPVGEIMFDSFGHRAEYTDRGMRKRALLAVGKVDYAYYDMIFPRDENVDILGASSDHTIIDIEDCERNLKVGDIMEFDLSYAVTVFLTNSPNVKIVFV